MASGSTDEDRVLRAVKSFLRSVLISSKNGVAACNLQREYKEMVGEFLPYRKLGFPTLEDFIQSVPDVVELRWRNGELFYQVVPDEATAHIHEMVSKQKSSNKKLRTARKPRGGGGGRSQPRGQASGGPRNRAPQAVRKTILPSPMGMPAFRAPVPSVGPATPIMVNVGNSATGSRTVRLGNKAKANRLFIQAMTAASSDKNEPKQGSRFEVPPRFRKQQGSQPPPPPQQPSRKPERTVVIKAGPKVVFPTVENGDMYMEALSKHCKQINQGLEFNTISARRDSETGYVSSIKLKNVVYGSEDVYRTAREAEEACAMVATKKLGLLQAKSERKDSSTSAGKSAMAGYPPEQLRIVRSRVKEMLSNKRNGLWGTVIPFAYKEKFKEEPPPDLIDMIRQWTDIARVELVETTGRDIIYPVEDTSLNKENEPPAKSEQVEDVKGEVMSKEKADTVVKDLIDLHKDTVKKQNEILKTLVIPREELLVLDEEVVVYMTYIHTPGYFCVQREDSIIDDMSAELQKYCQSKEAPSFEDLQKGQFCAGIYSGDNSWTRAEILQVKDSPPSLELLFVDFGNVETTSPDCIRWLSPETARIPVQAANCSLYGIEPLETENELSRRAAKEFAELVKEEALIAVPKQIYDDAVFDVELFLKSDPSVSINQKLVEMGVVRTVAKPILEEEVDELMEPPELVLPDGNEWDVYITFVTSTNSIMIRLVGDDYSEKLDAYGSKLEEAFKNSPSEAPIVMGEMYIAYDDVLYHRVRALSQEGQKVTCYFPDHGDTDWQIPDQLRPLDPEVNKLLPYQAIEVSLYGLEDVATNVTALSKLCDLALANTCVAEVVERGDISSVILYDTSQDEDININEAILQAVKDDNGGIDTPRTVSPAPGSNSQTPKQVISPFPSSSDVREKTGSSQSLKGADGQGSSKEKLGSSQSLKLADRLDTQMSDLVPVRSAEIPETSQDLTSSVVENVNVTKDSSKILPDQVTHNTIVDNVPKENLIQTSPRFTESWTNPSQTNETVKQSEKVDYNSNVNSKEPSQTSLHENFENLKLSNQNEEVPSITNDYNSYSHVIEKEPIKSVSDSESKKEWSVDGRTVWNRMEYFKRPLPPNFEIPPIGEYLEIHVNCIHDPSNFVCIPYNMMNELNQLLLDMIDYFHPAPPPFLKKDDIKVGQLYAGHKAGVWYRVKVKQFVSDSLVSVNLVDIGEYSVMMIEELQPLPWTFWKLPLQAINAKLSAIQPVSGNWSEAAKYKFIDLAREKDLIGLILEVEAESGVVSMTLIDTSDSNVDLCIDECLVKMNFAAYC